MTVGRKPKPTALHILNGSYKINPSRQNKNEPDASNDKPRCPRGLDKEAKRVWRETAGLLDEMGILSKTYAHLLEAYAVTWSQWKHATEMVARTGICIVQRGPDGQTEIKRNPFEAAMHKHRDALTKMQAEMGLTPSSKTRVHVEKKDRKVATRSRRA